MYNKLISLFKEKVQDSIILGLLGGFIGTLCMDFTNLLLYKVQKTETLYGHIAGQFFVPPIRTKRRKNFVLGELLHLAVGSVFGLSTMVLLKKTGKDHYLSKGLTTSMITWGILYTGGQKLGLFKRLNLTKTHYSETINNIVYGLASAKAMVTLADPNIFPVAHQMKEEKDGSINQNFEGLNLVVPSKIH